MEGSFSKGILSLVVKSPSKLSKKSIQSPDSFAEYYKEQEKDKEDYEKRISDFISNDTVSLTGILGDMADYGMDEFCLDEYIQHKFLAYGEKRTPSGNRHWITDLNIWLPGRHRMRKIWNLC